MWYRKSSIIYIFIYCSVAFIVAEDDCYRTVEVFDWGRETKLPARFTYGHSEETDQKNFCVTVRDVTEDFNLTVYVNPYITNSTNCSDAKPSDMKNIYKYWKNIRIKKNDPNSTYQKFPKALSGCYYGKITDKTGQKLFIYFEDYFHKETPFYDWNLHFGSQNFTPSDERTSDQFKLKLELKLACMRIEMQLFEGSEANRSCEREPIGRCSFTNTNHTCDVLKDGLRFEVNQILHSSKTGEWRAEITWSNLARDGVNYSSKFEIIPENCTMNQEDVMTWIPAYHFDVFNYGAKHEGNESKPPTGHSGELVELTFGILLTLILTIILIYWIRKWIRVLFRKKNHRIPQPDKELEEVPFSHAEILLIYVRSSTNSREKIMNYRNHLREKCRHRVRDIYSKNESNMLEDFGATMWVEKMMLTKDNIKFVWFDTPELRLHFQSLSDQQDHRDAAVSYLAKLTKTIFQNANTQYTRHFVVRLEGLDVTDEQDPLLVISPNTRYYLPQHFDALCIDLNK